MSGRFETSKAVSGYSQEPDLTSTSSKFPKASRLLRHAEFQRVYKLGKRQFTGNMTVFFLRRGEPAESCRASSRLRVGFTVGKVLGNAVERNRIKRRMREAVRLSNHNLDVPVDVVINPRKSVITLPMQQLSDEVNRGLKLAIQRARVAATGKETE